MKPLVLTREIKLEKYEVLMEIGLRESRAELNSVLMLTKEMGGKVSASDICENLLKGRPLQVGKAILDRCKYLDLIDYNGRLTEIGVESLNSGEVFIPEKGRYTIWYTDDPLVPMGFLSLEAIPESSLYNEVNEQRNNNKNGFQSEEIPEKISNLQGRAFSIFGKGGGRVQIRKIDQYGLSKSLTIQDNLHAELKISQNNTTKISFTGKFRLEGTRPDISFENSWISVIGEYASLWENTNNNSALKTSYTDLSEKEIFSFKKTLQLQRPTIPHLGDFNPTFVEEVPIKPRYLKDAESWATHLLFKSITTYLNNFDYQQIVKSCKSKFPDYPNLQLPTIDQLLEAFKSSRKSDGRLPREYWYLQAPLDLNQELI